MATRSVKASRYFLAFAIIMGVVYGLIFFTGTQRTPQLGLDLQGGTTVTLTARTPDGKAPASSDLELARQIIEQRVNGLGVAEAKVVTEGDSNIIISVPGEDGDQARQLGATAQLRFRPVLQGPEPAAVVEPDADAIGEDATGEDGAVADPELDTDRPPVTQEEAAAEYATLACETENVSGETSRSDDFVAVCSEDGTLKYLLGPTIIEGTEIRDSRAATEPSVGEWIVLLDFKSGGRQTWAEYTAANVGSNVGFTLDGRVVSAPVINGAISGQTTIQGSFDQTSATELANQLRYGALPLTFTQATAQSISTELGEEQLQAGLIAGAIGIVLVFVYALFYYRALGLVMIASLILSALVVYGALVLLSRQIGFTLSLAGIAGFIVSIGITADSFVVYFERIKDEIREGRSLRSAIPRAWVRARRTILSADAVSFLAAAILYVLAIGDVKGFAFTLGMSTVLDLVVVFLFTHPLMGVLSRYKSFGSSRISGLGSVAHTRRSPRPTAPPDRDLVAAGSAATPGTATGSTATGSTDRSSS